MIYAVTCVRNEEYNLPTFLAHIRDYVDGIIALDDGSTDNTLKILESDKKVKKIIKNPVREGIEYDEKGNRQKILKETYNFSSDKENTWVLCCDPDERFEINFLKNIQNYVT